MASWMATVVADARLAFDGIEAYALLLAGAALLAGSLAYQRHGDGAMRSNGFRINDIEQIMNDLRLGRQRWAQRLQSGTLDRVRAAAQRTQRRTAAPKHRKKETRIALSHFCVLHALSVEGCEVA
jgi:hypothetical protein